MNYNGYVNRKSPIHRFNPSLKFIACVILIVLIFLPYGFLLQTILGVIILTIYFIARIPIMKLFKILVSIFIMMLILFVVNWITYKGPGVVFDFDSKAINVFNYNLNSFGNNATQIGKKWFLQGYIWGGNFVELGELNGVLTSNKINIQSMICGQENGFYWIDEYSKNSKEISEMVKTLKNNGYSVIESIQDTDYFFYVYKSHWYTLSSFAIILVFSVSIKIFLMILIVTILTATTSSVELTYALEDILNPLRIFKFPVTVWSTTIALGIRFIPSLLDESDRIMKAQASRGLDFKNGNIKDKITSLTSFIVPLFSIAFKKADELANAMEARGFNPRFTRTRYRNYEIQWHDWLFYFILTILLGMVVALIWISHNQKTIYISPYGLLEIVSMFGI